MVSYRRMRERLERARQGPTWASRPRLAAANRLESPDRPSPEMPSLARVDGLWVLREAIDPAQVSADHFGPGFDLSYYLVSPEESGESARADSILFLDLETTGLSSHDQIFMTGALYFEDGELQLAQEIAGDVADESVLVERMVSLIRRRPQTVTYNGRSFDIPALRRRARFHGIEWREPDEVFDLLHPARRRYREDLPDCRLGTLEERVIGKQRSGRDIPGSEVPLRFMDFVDSGDLSHLAPVLYHNRIDLTTMVVLCPDLLSSDLDDQPARSCSRKRPDVPD